jgi:hypothetical protein
MSEKNKSPNPATAVLETLSVPDLERRLYELRGEEAAVKTLLRTLKARDRARRIPATVKGGR